MIEAIPYALVAALALTELGFVLRQRVVVVPLVAKRIDLSRSPLWFSVWTAIWAAMLVFAAYRLVTL